MRMVSITEIRRNAKAVLTDLVKTKKPVAILQRSKPIAYIIDAETFTRMQLTKDTDLAETRRESLDRILKLKERIKINSDEQTDSLSMIRNLREGINRNE